MTNTGIGVTQTPSSQNALTGILWEGLILNDLTFPLERDFPSDCTISWTAYLEKRHKLHTFFLDKGHASCPLQQTMMTLRIKPVNYIY